MRGSTISRWLYAPLLATISLSMVPAVGAGAAEVALFGADWDGWPDDVQEKILGTGYFGSVDVVNAAVTTPTAGDLAAYDAVLVWSQLGFDDPDTMGDVLADYLEAGGGIVIAAGSFDDGASWELRGRLVDDGYLPLDQADITTATNLTLVEDVPGHALLHDVLSFDGVPTASTTPRPPRHPGRPRWPAGATGSP